MAKRSAGALKTNNIEIVVDYVTDASGAYADGDLLAQPLKLEGAGFGDHYGGTTLLETITIIDKDVQGPEIVVVFHNEDPENCGTLNVAPTMAAAKADSCVGTVIVAAWEDIGDQSIGSNDSIGKSMKTDARGDLWAWLVSGGTPTFTAGTLLRVKFTFKRS